MLFPALFHALRALKVPVSLTEWLTLLEALAKGLHGHSLEDFYFLARGLLVKDVAHYDAFDQAFAHCFKGGDLPDDLATKEQVLAWLRDALSPLKLSEPELARMEALTLDELLRELEDRLRANARVVSAGPIPPSPSAP